MITNKKLSQLQVDRNSGKKTPKEKETIENYLEKGGKITKIDVKGKKIK